MYDTKFKNQAVKEYFNGNSLAKTARKFGISHTALRDWINDYRLHMAGGIENSGVPIENTALSAGFAQKDAGTDNYDQGNRTNLTIMPHHDEEHKMELQLKSVNVNIDGHEVTISKKDIKKLMGIIHQFDE